MTITEYKEERQRKEIFRFMKSIKKRAVCLVMAIAMILSLAACTKGGKGKQTATIDKNTIYKEEMINIKLPSDVNVYDVYFKKDKIYYYGYRYSDNDYSAQALWGTVNYDGTDMKEHKIDIQNGWVQNLMVADDGSIYLIYNEYIEDYSDPDNYISETHYVLKKLDSDGKEKTKIDLMEKYQCDWTRDVRLLADGTIFVMTSDKFVILDKDLKEVRSKAYDMFEGNFYTIKDGSLLVSAYDESGTKLYRFDLNKFERGEEVQIPFSLVNFGTRDGCGKYDFVLTDTTQVYTYNIGDAAPRALMNFVNSDLATANFNSIYLESDDVIYGFYNYYDEYEEGGNSAKFGKYTKVDPETIADKKLLSLGCLWVDNEVRKRVINFNKNSSEYRIVITDYSQYDTEEDWSAGTKKFNSDVASGQAPDIILASDPTIINNYLAKGLFADLTNYMKNDPDIDYDDIFPNLIKACSYNDKVYEVVPNFTVSTVAGKKSVLGDRKSWTMEEFLKFKNSLQPGMSMFADATRESMLNNFLSVNVGDYMEYGKGK